MGRGTRRTWATLLILEIGLMVILLTTASLLARRFVELRRLDLGFQPEGLEVASIVLPGATYPDPASRSRFFDDLLRRLNSVRDIASAAAIVPAPMQGGRVTTSFSIRGRKEPGEPQPGAELSVVSDGYLRTLGIELLDGRGFLPSDRAGAPEVAILSRAAARRYWGGESPLGTEIEMGDGKVVEVVGLAADARYDLDPSAPPGPRLYRPFRQEPWPTMSIVVRRRVGGDASEAWIRNPVAEIDAGVPVTSISSMERSLDEIRRPTRYLLLVLGGFAGTAVLVAAMGLYGLLMAMARTEEHATAIRMAVGAPRGRLARARLGHGLSIAGLGILIGWIGAFGIRRALWSVLPGEPVPGVVLLSGVAVAAVVLAVVASALPVLHVFRLDPTRSLRGEREAVPPG